MASLLATSCGRRYTALFAHVHFAQLKSLHGMKSMFLLYGKKVSSKPSSLKTKLRRNEK
jgi:hypothetical protein